MADERPVLVLYNPRSGGGEGARRATAISEALGRRGLAASLRETRPEAAPLEGASAAAFRALVVVGGDGSMHAAVGALEDLELPLAFCGTGTINVLARELTLPSDPERVAELVASGRTRRIPLFLANGRRFVLFAEVGWLGSAVRDVNAWRARTARHGKLEFARYGLAHLGRSWGRPLEARMVLADGRERAGRFSNVLATRARSYGGTMTLPLVRGGASLADPCFTVFASRMRTPLGNTLYLAAGAARAMALLSGGAVERHCVRSLTVEGPERVGLHLDAESDGEALRLPLVIEPTGEALRLLVP